MTARIAPETLKLADDKNRSAFEHMIIWRSVPEGFDQAERTFSPVSEILESDFEPEFIFEIDETGKARDVTERILDDAKDHEEKFLRDRYDAEDHEIQFGEYLWANSKFERRI